MCVYINFVGGVITDQAEADEDTSLKERVAVAVGKLQINLQCGSNLVLRKMFVFWNPHVFIGSTAAGVKDLDSMKYNSDGKAICSAVESMAEKVQEEMGEDKENEKEEETQEDA